MVAGQARGQESGRKAVASVGVCASIPHGRVGRLGAAIPEKCPVPLGSAVIGPLGGPRILMPAVCS